MAEFKNVLADALPRRFAIRLCEQWLPNKPMRQFRDAELRQIAEQLMEWPLIARGTEGCRTAK